MSALITTSIAKLLEQKMFRAEGTIKQCIKLVGALRQHNLKASPALVMPAMLLTLHVVTLCPPKCSCNYAPSMYTCACIVIIHTSMHRCIQASIHPCVHPSVRLPVHLLFHPCMRSCTYTHGQTGRLTNRQAQRQSVGRQADKQTWKHACIDVHLMESLVKSTC